MQSAVRRLDGTWVDVDGNLITVGSRVCDARHPKTMGWVVGFDHDRDTIHVVWDFIARFDTAEEAALSRHDWRLVSEWLHVRVVTDLDRWARALTGAAAHECAEGWRLRTKRYEYDASDLLRKGVTLR